jgi:corrinoid protein of di/trimethylamine methyltransferase
MNAPVILHICGDLRPVIPLMADIEPYRAIQDGLAVGMAMVGHKYETGEYFIPQLLVCSDAMYAAMAILRGALQTTDAKAGPAGTILIGVVEGDTHDIGKKIVKIMIESAGYQIIDLGRDTPATRFVEAAAREKPDVICLSTLMSATMDGMSEVIKRLEIEGLRQQTKVLIGGCSVSAAFARKIGADAYAPNAAAAVKTVDALTKLGAAPG